MSKAILIMNMPDCCLKCRAKFCIPGRMGKTTRYCSLVMTEIKDVTKRPDWCPLHLMPEEREENHTGTYEDIFNEGWNACIEAIGGSENE